MISIGGCYGEKPPGNAVDFLNFAGQLRTPTIYNAIRRAARLSEVARFGRPMGAHFPECTIPLRPPGWEHWRVAELRAEYTTDPYYEDSLLPIMESGQAELVATDYAFDDNVRIEPWTGHTPGHVCVVVGSPQASVVLSGDIMHTPLQCAEPQLNSCFCVDAEMARATRRRFIETFADRPVMIIPAHFPTPTAGWIRAEDGSFRFRFDDLR